MDVHMGAKRGGWPRMKGKSGSTLEQSAKGIYYKVTPRLHVHMCWENTQTREKSTIGDIRKCIQEQGAGRTVLADNQQCVEV